MTPGTLPFLGQNITITPTGARDTDGTIAQVRFYLETTGNSNLDTAGPGGDLLIGTDVSAVGGWTLSLAALADLGEGMGFAVGSNRVYAMVVDNDGGTTAIGQNFTITATNAAATIGAVMSTVNPVNRQNNTTLVATTLADADGAVTRVEFFRDANGNGILDLGIDTLLGTSNVSAGQATLVVNTRTFSAGENTIFARPIDNRNAPGIATEGTVTVNNLTPTITSVTDSPDPVVVIGNNLTLTAVGVADRDGTIASVAFYRDNGDNVFNIDPEDDIEDDIFLAIDSSATGGYSAIVNTGDNAFGFVPAPPTAFSLWSPTMTAGPPPPAPPTASTPRPSWPTSTSRRFPSCGPGRSRSRSAASTTMLASPVCSSSAIAIPTTSLTPPTSSSATPPAWARPASGPSPPAGPFCPRAATRSTPGLATPAGPSAGIAISVVVVI